MAGSERLKPEFGLPGMSVRCAAIKDEMHDSAAMVLRRHGRDPRTISGSGKSRLSRPDWLAPYTSRLVIALTPPPVYAKSEQENLTPYEKQRIKAVIAATERELERLIHNPGRHDEN